MKINLTPILLAYERLLRAQRSERVCICPSHASNRGECPVHDELGRARRTSRWEASDREQQPTTRDEHLEAALAENSRLHSEVRQLRCALREVSNQDTRDA